MEDEVQDALNPEVAELIAALQTPIKMDVWKFHLAETLSGFRRAIPSIHATVNTATIKSPFTLTDAAYVLYNAGCVWSKRVDEIRKDCLKMADLVSNVENRKKQEEDEDDAEKKAKPRKRAAHPLAMQTEDCIGGGIGGGIGDVEFFQDRSNNKENPHRDRVLVKQIEQLPLDRYLAEVQPRSLGLLEFEKIRPYEDDRGIKGNDWAEYQINTLKLNSEGYFLLQRDHPDHYEFMKEQILPVRRSEFQMPNTDDMAPIPQDSFSNPGLPDNDDPFDGGDQNMEADAADGNANNANANNANANNANSNNANAPPKRENGKLSPGRPDRIQALPNVPFKGKLSIMAEMRSRGLDKVQPPPHIEAEYFPYKRRNRRILKPAPKRHISAEVVFFQNFWDIRPGSSYCEPRLKKIFHRLRTRLRRVTPPVERRGRGRKRDLEATFVSCDELDVVGAPMSSPIADLDFGSGRKRGADDEGEEFGGFDLGDDGAEYEETDKPIANTLIFDEMEKLDFVDFGEMRRQGLFAPPADRYEDDFHDYSSTVASAPAVQVDLYDWERRLNKFLDVHEHQTSSFDLVKFGKELVVNCEKEAGHNVQSVSQMVTRRTSGDVCRSFLSMLDLANKNVLQFESPRESKHAPDSASQSQGVQEMGVRIC